MLDRVLDIRRQERAAVVLAFCYFFCLLCGYYILRPLRDEMGIQGGVANLPWVFTGTLAAMLVAVPLYGWAAARFPRRRMLPAVYGFFLLNLLLFYGLFRAGVAPGLLARAFFIWVSVYNLFVVAVFWSFMVDLFAPEQGKRLFGFIAAGGSAGALTGPAITALLAAPLGTVNLLLASALFLLLATACLLALLAWARAHPAAHAPGPQPGEHGLGGGVWGGLTELARSPYLLGICGYMLLYTTLSTFLYFQQARIVADSIAVSEQRTALFAAMDLAVNALSLFGQVFVASRVLGRFGVAAALAVVPVLSMAGFAALGAWPLLAVVVTFQVLRRALDFAIARPAREVLFTVLDREAKYKAKSVTDTVVYRAGDAIGGWIFTGLRTLGAGIAGTAFIAIPLAALWLVLSVMLGRRQEAMSRESTAAHASK